MAQSKKIKIEGIPTPTELDQIFDMALIFSGSAIVYLRDDVKEIADVVVGDELLGWRGEYRKVTAIYRPKFFPVMMKYGIGIKGNGRDRDFTSYLEIGEGTQIAARNFFPAYDPVPSPRKARDLNIHLDSVEVCDVDDHGTKYKPGELMKLVQKRCDTTAPYLIGIEGNYLVVNNIVISGCNSTKIKQFIEKEKKQNEQPTKTEVGDDVSEIKRLRDDSEVIESFFSICDSADSW